MFWNNEYKNNERIWGERPSELAIVAVRYLQECKPNNEILSILEIGCGYGRDVLYFSKHLRCTALGIDNSEKAIDMARNTCHEISNENMKFGCCDFAELGEDRYDVIFIANLYHLLRPAERDRLINKIKKALRPGGLLFLNALSTNDAEEYGKGIVIHIYKPHKPIAAGIITINIKNILLSIPGFLDNETCLSKSINFLTIIKGIIPKP